MVVVPCQSPLACRPSPHRWGDRCAHRFPKTIGVAARRNGRWAGGV